MVERMENGDGASLGSTLSPDLDLVSFLFGGRAGEPANADKPALVDAKSQSSVSYGELRRSVAAAAGGMLSLGVRPGDVVMIVMANCVEYPMILLGAMAAGAAVTTGNPLSTVKELQKQVRDSGACILATSADLAAKAGALGLPLVLVGENTAALKMDFVPFRKLLEANPCSLPAGPMRSSSTAALLYSSGTTGLSKGVVLSHGNFIAALESIKQARKEAPEDEVELGILPMFHIAGMVYGILNAIRNGITLVVLRNFDLVDVFEAIERYQVSFMPCVPPIVIAFTKNHHLSRKYNLSSLRFIACGAAPLGKEIMDAFLACYPQVTQFPQAYGMTETTAVGFGLSNDALRGSAGKVMPNVEAKVIDIETGKPLPPNYKGELCLRGPFIMQGYLNNPRATTETVDGEGWLHTGDLVYLDIDGSMFVVDRLKELIKYKGFQVAPAELEAILLSHPSITDCAVVPLPDEEAGEIPLAYVVRGPETSLTETEIIKFVSDQVAPHKRIRKVAFLDVVPKSATGKILRKDLIKSARSKL